jgi:hypothetical protein
MLTVARVRACFLRGRQSTIARAPSFRAAGSVRLYEDPDIDEYEGPDDAGYWRRDVLRQDEFAALHLERPRVRRRRGGGAPRGAS